jgi:hypothetical protein
VCDGYGQGGENFISETIKVGANGDGSSASAVFGYPGANVWVNVGAKWPDGVQSNKVNWSAT